MDDMTTRDGVIGAAPSPVELDRVVIDMLRSYNGDGVRIAMRITPDEADQLAKGLQEAAEFVRTRDGEV